MFDLVRKKAARLWYGLPPEGEAGVRLIGHREYVGGLWDRVGQLQFDFLIARGLRPEHCFLDIACGSLRGGVHFIRYLDKGNYLGLDKEEVLIAKGIEEELGPGIYREKMPEFVISSDFEFHKFSKRPHFSLAQSLFTHLTAQDIRACFIRLRAFVDGDHQLFATFSEGNPRGNRSASHSHAGFKYARAEMEAFGSQTGWTPTYVGSWGHPRGQVMVWYQAR
jgi:hypothetical protein